MKGKTQTTERNIAFALSLLADDHSEVVSLLRSSVLQTAVRELKEELKEELKDLAREDLLEDFRESECQAFRRQLYEDAVVPEPETMSEAGKKAAEIEIERLAEAVRLDVRSKATREIEQLMRNAEREVKMEVRRQLSALRELTKLLSARMSNEGSQQIEKMRTRYDRAWGALAREWDKNRRAHKESVSDQQDRVVGEWARMLSSHVRRLTTGSRLCRICLGCEDTNVSVVHLAGRSHCPDVGIATGQRLQLVAEPSNPHDSRAVQVINEEGKRVAYVAREENEPISKRLLAHRQCLGIVGETERGRPLLFVFWDDEAK